MNCGTSSAKGSVTRSCSNFLCPRKINRPNPKRNARQTSKSREQAADHQGRTATSVDPSRSKS